MWARFSRGSVMKTLVAFGQSRWVRTELLFSKYILAVCSLLQKNPDKRDALKTLSPTFEIVMRRTGPPFWAIFSQFCVLAIYFTQLQTESIERWICTSRCVCPSSAASSLLVGILCRHSNCPLDCVAISTSGVQGGVSEYVLSFIFCAVASHLYGLFVSYLEW